MTKRGSSAPGLETPCFINTYYYLSLLYYYHIIFTYFLCYYQVHNVINRSTMGHNVD